MYRLLLILTLNAITLTAFSQRSPVLQKEDLKGFKFEKVISVYSVDDSTRMITAYGEENYSYYPMLFKTVGIPGTKNYTVERLDNTFKEVYTNFASAYFKMGEKIFRCRQKVSMLEVVFYLDTLVGNRFESSKEPFYRDSIDNGCAFDIELIPAGNSLFMTTRSKSEIAATTFSMLEFESATMQLLASGEMKISLRDYTNLIHSIVNEDELISYYQSNDAGVNVVRILFLDKSGPGKEKLREIKYAPKPDLNLQSFVVSSGTKNPYLSVLYKDQTFLFEHHVAEFDTKDFGVKAVNVYRIPVPVLNNDYFVDPAELQMKLSLREREFKFSQAKEDKNGDHYIFYYGMNTLRETKSTKEMEYNDLLLVKISSGSVAWSQLIRRGKRTERQYGVFPEIKILENEVQLIDYEWKNFFSQNGEYISKLTKTNFGGSFNMHDVEILVDKNSGKITRKIIGTQAP